MTEYEQDLQVEEPTAVNEEVGRPNQIYPHAPQLIQHLAGFELDDIGADIALVDLPRRAPMIDGAAREIIDNHHVYSCEHGLVVVWNELTSMVHVWRTTLAKA